MEQSTSELKKRRRYLKRRIQSFIQSNSRIIRFMTTSQTKSLRDWSDELDKIEYELRMCNELE